MIDRCQEKMVKKLVSLFKGDEKKAESLVRSRLAKEENLRYRAILNNEEYKPLDLLDLIIGFAKLAGAPVTRQTPLVKLLEIELRTDSWAGKFSEPKEVFDLASLPLMHAVVSNSPVQKNIH
jgi:hypothetical protein